MVMDKTLNQLQRSLRLPQLNVLRKAKGKHHGVGNITCQRGHLKMLLHCANCVPRKVANMRRHDMMALRGTWLGTFCPYMG